VLQLLPGVADGDEIIHQFKGSGYYYQAFYLRCQIVGLKTDVFRSNEGDEVVDQGGIDELVGHIFGQE
jgi:hypothetical protein